MCLPRPCHGAMQRSYHGIMHSCCLCSQFARGERIRGLAITSMSHLFQGDGGWQVLPSSAVPIPLDHHVTSVGHAHMRPEAHSSTASSSSQGAGAVVMKNPEVNLLEDKGGKERKQKKSKKEGDKKSTKKARLA